MIEFFTNPGVAQRSCPYLQIPLHADYHTGTFGIDAGTGTFKGVREWECAFGKQIDMLNEVSGLVGYNVIQSARIWIQQNSKL